MATNIYSGELRNPDFSAFIAAFTNFLVTRRDYIWQSLFFGMFEPENPYGLAGRAVPMEGINRPQLLPSLNIGNVVQAQNSKQMNAKGAITMGGRVLTPEKWKIDFIFNYDEIWQGYVQSFRLQKDGLIPTEQNVIEELHTIFLGMIFKRISADLREGIYKGSKAVGTGHLQVFDGFNKIIKDAATATLHTPVVLNVTSPSDVLPKIKTLVENLGPAYRRSPDCIVKVATDVYNFATSTASGLGTATPTIVINNGNREDIAMDILGTPLPFAKNIKLVEEPYLKAGAMIATVKSNFVVGFDSFDPFSQITVQPNYQEQLLIARGAIGCQVRAFSPENGELPFICNTAAVA